MTTDAGESVLVGKILVVDDEANACAALVELLTGDGFEVRGAENGVAALAELERFAADVVLTDVKMPEMDGLELLDQVQQRYPEIVVVVMTGFGDVATAVEAMTRGAADYLTKPINFDELIVILRRVLEQRRLAQETTVLRTRLAEERGFSGLIGDSGPMKKVYAVIERVAPSRASVLITGPSGTGKELVACALHERSPRNRGPFIRLHCAALAETLLESELFGHERGAFTGAVARHEGRFQLADGGTLFLDEIGEISPAVQVKLLRFLQEREFERVGGTETISVDVRLIAATNCNLADAVKEGRFREDLYYRLNVVGIDMPPLADRVSDIPLLASHFLARFAEENGRAVSGFSPQALQAIESYSWPGNVRELENAVERAVVMCSGSLILPEHLPRSVAPPVESDGPSIPGSTLDEIERFTILKTLESTRGSTSKAAEILGISVRKVQYKLHEYQAAPKSKVDVVKDAGSE